MLKYKIAKDDIGRALEEFYHCRFVQYNDKTVIPGDLIKNLKRDFLRRELWVPQEKIDGKIHVIVDDPNNILKRDTIENLLKTKQVKYDIAMAEDIIKFINLFYHSSDNEHSFTEILGRLDDEDTIIEDEEGGEMITESDSVIMQLVNKIINDAYGSGASDIHIDPNQQQKKRGDKVPH
jgi:type II secretory ATPase GspE/PulE/Tfp pilus assembly ATPase PilB-like protein